MRQPFPDAMLNRHNHGPGAGRGGDSASRALVAGRVAEELRLVAQDAGAEGAGIYLVSPTSEDRSLTPLVDTTHPALSKRTQFLAVSSGDCLARRSRATTQPCWWCPDDASLIAASLGRCIWAERVPAPEGLAAALALPLIDECDRVGLAVLWGEGIALSMPALADLQARCLVMFARLAGSRTEPARAVPPVSRRELECLKLTANGQTSEEIAAALQLSVHTANQYLANSAGKLNATNRMHAVAKALRLGLID